VLLRISVKVKPGSRKPGLTRVESALVIAVRERAVDGRANAAAIAVVAAWLDVAPSRVTIEHGASGRSKRLAIDGLDEHAYAVALETLQP
jgi:uncharacterized protein